MTTASEKELRRRRAIERKEREVSEQAPKIHAEVVVFFKPGCAPANLLPEDGPEPPFVCKAFRHCMMQFQAMQTSTLVAIDEGKEGSRHFFHWDDIAHIEVVDSKLTVN